MMQVLRIGVCLYKIPKGRDMSVKRIMICHKTVFNFEGLVLQREALARGLFCLLQMSNVVS